MNNKFNQYLATIQKEWMEPKVVASSYASYIDSKIEIASEIRNSIYQSVSYLEQLDPISQELADISIGNYTDSIKQILSRTTGYNFGSLMNIAIPTSAGDLVQLREVISKYAKAVKDNTDVIICTSLNNNDITMTDILESLNNGIDLNFAISSALDGYANDKTPSDYLSELAANLGDRFQNVSSYASKAFNILRDSNINVMDKIRTLINPITEFDDASVSGNFINADVDTSMYAGVSPAVFWFDASLNAVEAIANIYIANMKLAWQITVAIFKVVSSLFVAIWNKFLRGLFVTDDIVVNDNYNCDYLNIPRSQYEVKLDFNGASYQGYSKLTDVLISNFGYSSVTNQDIFNALFDNGYAIDIPTKFGLIRLLRKGTSIVRQIYLTPNTPISTNDLNWLTYDDRQNQVVSSTNNKSIDDQFKALFVNSTTEDINIEKNDVYYWRAFQTSIARMDFFLGLISTSFMLEQSDYSDITCSKLFEGNSPLAYLFGVLQYISPSDSSTLTLGYLSPSSNYNLVNGLTRVQISQTRVDLIPVGNPSNADFLMLIAMNTLNVCGVDESWLFAAFPYFSCWSLIAYLYATTKYGMSQLVSQGGTLDNVTFIPYNRSNRNDFVFKYMLASDDYNREAFNKQLKLTARTAIVIAASFVIFRGIKALKAKALTNMQISQSNMWNRINDPELTQQEFKELQDDLYIANKRYNRIYSTSSSIGGINLSNSNTDVGSIIKLIK